MSVINNVLKDLETRESRFTPIDIDAVASAPRKRRDMRLPALLALALPLMAAAGWIYLQQQEPRAVAKAEPSPVVVETVAPPSSQIAQQAPPVTEPGVAEPGPESVIEEILTDEIIGNQIVGLQIRESAQEMRMAFVLREKVVAYLRERGENRFAYHLRDIESQIVAPLISDNPWIRALAIKRTDAGVDIIFETVPGILVETRQNQVDGEPVWAINLKQTPPPELAASVPVEETADAPASEAETGGSEDAAEVAALAVEAVHPVEPPAPAKEAAPAKEVRLEIKTTDPNSKVANQLEYATRLIKSGRYSDAETLLRELLGGVEDYQARRHLLALYQGQGSRERFDRLARESSMAYPNDAIFETEYARALFHNGAYHRIIELFAAQKALDASRQALLAASYQRLDQHDHAIRHYRLALRLDAANAKNWIGLGISQEHSANFEAALAAYQRAGRLGPLNERLQAFVEQRSDTLRQVLN